MNNTPFARYRHLIDEKTIRPDPHQKAAIEALHDLHAKVIKTGVKKRKSGWNPFSKKDSTRGIKGLYIYGSVGRGKSMLMDLFFDCLPSSVPKRRAHFHEFMIGVHEYLHKARRNDESDKAVANFAKELAETTKVLCFDEFHVTDIADAMILGRLFGALFAHGVIVVATSNWPPDRLYENGLQRERFLPFIDLLKASMDVMPLDGPIDYRLQNLAEGDIFITPLGTVTHRKMDDIFDALSGGAPAKDETLTVKGHKVTVTAAGKIARSSFANLCEQPHGAEDFLAIAHEYDTIMIENVPRLGYDRRNEAKRFMILIDALYEAKCNIVISADAPVEKLYTGQDHAFEFERTVSRLIEMQSADYREQKATAHKKKDQKNAG